jgi:biotin synthase
MWKEDQVAELFELPLLELLYRAQSHHRQNFALNEIELCSLLSVKTGKCPEDCAYCPQSAHYTTNTQQEQMLGVEAVRRQARAAKQEGAIRLCIGAAWRTPPKKGLEEIIAMIQAIKAEGLQACATLGMIDLEQAIKLKQAGLDYYNHNLDSSRQYYSRIITTRTYEDRLRTLENVRAAGINTCCGGIVGMGEERADRIKLLVELANLPEVPLSVPINRLIPIKGTPLEGSIPIDNIEFVKTIAVARILMPRSVIRLSAGRDELSEETQILCFLAGANSFWLGDKLLTQSNPAIDEDMMMLERLGLKAKILPNSYAD